MFPDHLIIDFDSTFITKESLDELAHLVLLNHKNGVERLKSIKALTLSGMEGKIPFDLSLEKRIALINTNKNDIKQISSELSKEVSPSIKKNKLFIKKNSSNILIFSGGFKEIIIPIVSEYGINEKQIFANQFIYDSNDNVIGIDKNNNMSKKSGKVLMIKALKLSGKIDVIGDGFTDYEIKKSGLASNFYAFIENINREKINQLSDKALNSFDDYINIVND
ncbi:MAG: HAD-IB family phosphatase [Candidatus Marinimicrobia bacterium]|nr:HAD-IB family phosphatase [Candidatus Neomarinimicrobiota bacterium]MBT4318055.1 HAD-IB family phosphatase [Candidatus Neomarinimicrobiota bacterium]